LNNDNNNNNNKTSNRNPNIGKFLPDAVQGSPKHKTDGSPGAEGTVATCSSRLPTNC
jgi:hypothetical protein